MVTAKVSVTHWTNQTGQIETDASVEFSSGKSVVSWKKHYDFGEPTVQQIVKTARLEVFEQLLDKG